MKFAQKLVLFIISIISMILACSRYYIVKNNFIHAIENSNKQNTSQHILEKYMLESDIINKIQTGEEVTNEKMITFFKSLYTHMENQEEFVALYDDNFTCIYTDIENIDKMDIHLIFNKEAEINCIKQLGDQYYMLFSSHWSVNNKGIYILNAYDITSIFEERDRQLQDLLLTDVMILLISTIVISVFSIFLTKPIAILNKTSKSIASGNFHERVQMQTKDEVGELATSFNQMANQIENKINALNLQVKQKNDFINAFTHELKTPITAITGYADMLRLKQYDEETAKKALQYIYTESKRLENLSSKLMALVSLSEEKIMFTNFNVKDFLEKICKKENFILEKYSIQCTLEDTNIRADKALFEVVIRNLVENASKAEPKDKIIFIKGEKVENQKYRISIIDHGKGIPKEHIDRVTEDFYMVDTSRSRKNGGSGIGLSLVKKILDLHHSKLYIESTENMGTTVSFDLEEVIS